MRFTLAFALASGLAVGLPALAGGCSSDPAPAAPSPDASAEAARPSAPPCDPSKCAEGNLCVEFEGASKCRRPCGSKFGDLCPPSHSCVPHPEVGGFCEPVHPAMTVKATGQWGAPCVPTQGLANPACDGDQGFQCYAPGGTADAEAYCTRFDCEDDRDCADTYVCESANVAPNAESNERLPGRVRKTCVKRDYCAPCRFDSDCPQIKGATQFCVAQADGRKICAPTCQRDLNCNDEAECLVEGLRVWPDGTERETNVCIPRSGLCVGDGSICAGCRSDADCPAGACVRGEFSTERSCTVKSKVPCRVEGSGTAARLVADCPARPEALPEGTRISCIGGDLAFKEVPPDQCHGLVDLDESVQPGCWTRARKR